MRRHKPYIFEKSWVLLCEGESDKRFFDRLIQARNIDPLFYVQFPDQGERVTGGRNKFGRWLEINRSVSESFRANVKAILIVSDKDDDEAISFNAVKREIEKAPGFPVPPLERTVATSDGFPAMVILMIPMEGLGNLETLCLDAAHDKWNLRDELNNLVDASPAAEWGLSKQCKMKLQTILAATCKARPDTSFAQHWCQNAKYRVPLDHRCFDSIADFLRNFDTLVAEP
ncbi:MAG: DUF3226 domain-containing protein [Desulfomonile sp.]|jgi:hypothetical protein